MKQLLSFIRNKKYNMAKVLSLLGFEGVRKVSVFSLKDGLLRLWSGCS